MAHLAIRVLRSFILLTTPILLIGSGCHMLPFSSQPLPTAPAAVPRELSKTVLPTYRVEPPDILMIDSVNIVPRAPYFLRTLDSISIDVQGTLPESPINGVYTIMPGGLVQIGSPYGSIQLAGLTIEQAKVAISGHLLTFLREPMVTVTLVNMAAQQQISGQHLVGPDGNVTLGVYGSVSVVGCTVSEAKWAIERHLAQYLDAPEVSVDVFAYNSKVYYIVTQGAGLGDGVFRFPITGNETVLDAISNINGLEQVSSKKIWIARPTPQSNNVQILPVSWNEITSQACTNTNYQVMPGDRVFIAEDKLIAFDTAIGKLTAPLERIMGFSMLGAGTATRLSGNVLQGGGNPRNF